MNAEDGIFPRPVKIVNEDFSCGLIKTKNELADVIEQKTHGDLSSKQKRKLVNALYKNFDNLLAGRRPENMIAVSVGSIGNERITHYLSTRMPQGAFKVAIGYREFDEDEPEVEILSLGLAKQFAHPRVISQAGQEVVKFKTKFNRKRFH